MCQWMKSCQNARGKVQDPTICGLLEVTKVDPIDGPLQGGTSVSIWGKNFGVIKDEMARKVELAGVPCDVKAVSSSGDSFVCISGRSASPGAGLVNVLSNVDSSSPQFSYKNVSLQSYFPRGCSSDISSSITFEIDNFFIGRSRDIKMTPRPSCRNAGSSGGSEGESLKLSVSDKNSTHFSVKCPSCPENKGLTYHKLTAYVDGLKLIVSDRFQFSPFPSLKSQLDNRSIDNGGVKIRFQTDFPSFGIILTMRLERRGVVSHTSNCTWIERNVRCEVPSKPNSSVARYRRASEESAAWNLVFSAYPSGNITKLLVYPELKFVPNPEFEKVNGTIEVHDFIRINAAEGANLLLGARPEDYAVQLGNELYTDQVKVYYDLIHVAVASLSNVEKDKPIEMQVKVGTKFSTAIGVVTIVTVEPAPELLPIILPIVFILFILFFAIAFWIKRRSDQKQLAMRLQQVMELNEIVADAVSKERNAT